ncbi:hypothetical protein UCRPC4_g02915 [Phaeomoniella chlamydospora]|uniref:Uncharacterized protein n=1 Tax=Phaeomoniella chlamydospora TaxID=158046 RepID=A0A0G2EL11_PHACM|nr:hypothetical protein UCRPC4_g02915 [Phaeomoniella chlamydospora]
MTVAEQMEWKRMREDALKKKIADLKLQAEWAEQEERNVTGEVSNRWGAEGSAGASVSQSSYTAGPNQAQLTKAERLLMQAEILENIGVRGCDEDIQKRLREFKYDPPVMPQNKASRKGERANR